ncbi:hypothetical protein DNU06_01330 [Putridiphycobacter roseus]|uniref:Uncharacterized protein n=1 Tax=Putridiphycobacter roseus TaxID=2219161 RepID=A0A2W1N3T6_9FLAO|nr:oligosaccharide flippase family protein [Putridiphycobacter roseus]PZE18504.1 hypothetical protein DNU06_01330 [Putridiphycobacter roseus]
MQKKFLFNLALILLLNVIVKPFYILGIDAEVQNQVGTAQYGLYFSLLNLSFLFNMFLDFGIVNYNTRNIAQHPNLLSSYFSKLSSIRILLFGFYLSILLLVGFFIGYKPDQLYLLLLLAINQCIVASIQFLRSNITGLHWFKTEAMLSVLDRLLLIIFCSLLLWSNLFSQHITIEWFIYAQMLAYTLTFFTALFVLKNEIKPFHFKLSKTITTSLLKQSFPYALLIFLMFIYNRIDSIMLERILPNGEIQAGIYAQGFRYLDAINMFALLFAGLLLPIYARLLKQKESIYQMVEIPIRLLIGGSLIISITCFYHAEFIMGLRYQHFVVESALPFAILILSFIPISFTYIFGTALTANGSLKALNWMAIAGVILNISLNLIFIPKLEAYGAAIATLITQFFTALVQIIIAYKIFQFKINTKLLFGMVGFTFLLWGINSDYIFHYQYAAPRFILTLMGSIFGLFFFRIIKISTLIQFLKKAFKEKSVKES